MLQQCIEMVADDDRRGRILSAAERAFVRHGFHAASMQTIAAEAKMSAGNIYRYFDSKDAIVVGLVERDQAMIALDFKNLAQASDIFATLETILRRLFVEAPLGRHRLIIEIWAEMGRNPRLTSHCGGVDHALHARLRSVVDGARLNGFAAPHVDADFVARIMATVVAGLFKRRATETGFDGIREVALALGVIRAAFAGVLKPWRSTDVEGVL